MLLFWVFFEMSGGMDFVPKSERETQRMAKAHTSDWADHYVPFDQPIITSPAPVQVAQAPSAAETSHVIQASLTEVSTFDTQMTGEPAVIKTVAPQFDATDETGDTPEPRRDIRIIAGDWVNMRQGPGTDFGVVTTLPRGTEAEIIDETADQWARIRLLETGQVGWMASWLLSD
ncbi:hypothetical protein RCCS2_12769 [Roseobacter sp. CCS2]|nr:hypothetical protein RCCS2_12769 [Roseobacter sp. CCS2]